MSETLDRFADRFHPARVPAGAYSDPNDVLLFIHIPKTAGVSIGAGLQDVFDTFHGVSWQNTNQSFVELTRAALYARSETPQRQVLMGHYGSQQLRFWRDHKLPIKAATIIRDPIARAVSNYNYNISDRHPGNAEFRQRYPNLTDYVEDLPFDFQLTKLLGAFYSFEHALDRLIEDFTFLGVTERLAASLAHLSRSHGLGRIPLHEKNRGPKGAVEIDATARRTVIEKSANDLRLFDLLSSYYA